MSQLNSHQRGLLMTIFGVLVLTPDALMLRLIEADLWTTLFWRSLFMTASLFAINAWIEQRNPLYALRDLFKDGLFCALLFTGSNICFVISITHTMVANTLVILAAMPFMAAIMAIVLMRQILPLRTWLTILLAIAGIVMVFWGRVGSGGFFGDVMAVLVALFMASALVAINHNPRINSLAAIGLGSFLAGAFAFFMGAELTTPSGTDFAILALNGGLILPVAMGLITYGPKLISAAEVSLIMLLETVLGPLWVWYVLSEQPPIQTLIGGSLVLGAIMVNAWLGFRSDR